MEGTAGRKRWGPSRLVEVRQGGRFLFVGEVAPNFEVGCQFPFGFLYVYITLTSIQGEMP